MTKALRFTAARLAATKASAWLWPGEDPESGRAKDSLGRVHPVRADAAQRAMEELPDEALGRILTLAKMGLGDTTTAVLARAALNWVRSQRESAWWCTQDQYLAELADALVVADIIDAAMGDWGTDGTETARACIDDARKCYRDGRGWPPGTPVPELRALGASSDLRARFRGYAIIAMAAEYQIVKSLSFSKAEIDLATRHHEHPARVFAAIRERGTLDAAVLGPVLDAATPALAIGAL